MFSWICVTQVSTGATIPDPDHMKTLEQNPVPTVGNSLLTIIGLAWRTAGISFCERRATADSDIKTKGALWPVP